MAAPTAIAQLIYDLRRDVDAPPLLLLLSRRLAPRMCLYSCLMAISWVTLLEDFDALAVLLCLGGVFLQSHYQLRVITFMLVHQISVTLVT